MTEHIQVLLADDEKIFVQSLAKLLKKKNIAATTAADGFLAVETVRQNVFDVIVLDLKMPNMDGLAALEAIRQFDTVTPVLLLTGEIDLERVTKALKDGASEVLLKPCPLDTLVTAIENASERKAALEEVKAKIK